MLIAYSFGYRYSFERGIFIYSGAIVLKTNPSQVSIALDGTPLERNKVSIINGSNQIDGLRPGRYRIDITAPGFQTWSKSITVESGRASEFWNIILPRQEYTIETLPMQNVIGIYPSPEGRFLAIAQDNGTEMLVILHDTQTQINTQIFSSLTATRHTTWQSNIEWSPDEKTLLIPTINRETISSSNLTALSSPDEVFLIDIATFASQKVSDITQTSPLRMLRWGPRSNTLYALSDTSLITFIPNREKTQWEQETLFTDILSYDFSSSDLYTMKTNGILYKSDRLGKNEEQITTTQTQYFTKDDSISLIAYDKDRIAGRSETGILWIWNQGEQEQYTYALDENVQGMQFSNDGKKLLYWTDLSIKTYFLREWDVQPKREENSFLTVATFTSPLSNVAWTKQYEHILYVSENTIKITELDHRDRRMTQTLSPQLSENALIRQIFLQDEIFFTAPNEDKENVLQYIEFPEPATGFFGFGG